jgi:hypothetical protein
LRTPRDRRRLVRTAAGIAVRVGIPGAPHGGWVDALISEGNVLVASQTHATSSQRAHLGGGTATKLVTIAVWLSISTNGALATADVFHATPTRAPHSHWQNQVKISLSQSLVRSLPPRSVELTAPRRNLRGRLQLKNVAEAAPREHAQHSAPRVRYVGNRGDVI